ncbi:MAG: ribosome biogenesis GTPase Der [Bacillota bacterium]|nr:ribosome biogenesis GTPase Der [Bacillota bacterium]
MAEPLVAIVGRPNVGKSTLFNRLVGEEKAIVDPTPGVTRDRLFARTDWRGRPLLLVDTGGIEPEEDDAIGRQTRRQAELAIASADLILFVVDGQAGLLPGDEEVADLLRRSGRPVLVVVNKVDRPADCETARAEFAALGLGEPLPISALHGTGTGDLLDRVWKLLPPAEEEEERAAVHLAVIGRPNVGKSSLVNAILGEERVIVSELPGTTRDAVDTPFSWQGHPLVIIDTAGLRRRGERQSAVERYSILRTLRAIERADVCVVVFDATAGLTAQDKRVAGYASQAGRGIVLALNKWDAVTGTMRDTTRFERQVRAELDFLAYAPLVFVSALRRQRIGRLLETCLSVAAEHSRRIPTGVLNQFLEDALARHEPPARKGKQLKIFYGAQVAVKPPRFVFFVNAPHLVHFSYRRYLENRLREAFGFQGTPLILEFRLRG